MEILILNKNKLACGANAPLNPGIGICDQYEAVLPHIRAVVIFNGLRRVCIACEFCAAHI